MSRLLKFNWNPLTPGSDPAGARISAGKSGKVLISLPNTAEVFVNCVPVTCIPSPESPANRMVTSCKSFLSLTDINALQMYGVFSNYNSLELRMETSILAAVRLVDGVSGKLAIQRFTVDS